MSTFKAEVVKVIVDVHPNADRLDLIKVKGWQCVSQRGLYKTDDLAVYLPIDSVLPEQLVRDLEIGNYYHRKLRTLKLRGAISQGMIIGLKHLPVKEYVEGEDVTEQLGITKWEEPIPIQMRGKLRQRDERFIRYTDIENAKNYPDTIPEGTIVIATEKIHGTNFRVANIEGEIHVGSHRMDLVEEPENLYWRAANLLGVKEKLQPGEQIFGEIYGKGIQDLSYGVKDGQIAVGIFDVWKDNRYLNYGEMASFCMLKGWVENVVPNIYMGEWSAEKAKLASGNSSIAPDQIKEGVVVKPMVETHSEKLCGRLILKYINDEYLLRKDATERH